MPRPFFKAEPDLFHYNRELSADKMPTSHFHPTYEVYYLISGKRRYFIKDKVYEIRPGDLVLIPPQVVHKVSNSIENREGDFHARYLLSFSESSLNQSLKKRFTRYYYHLDKKDSQYIKTLIEKMGEDIKYYDDYSLQLYNAHLTELLIYLLRNYSQIEDSPTESKSRINHILDEIAQYIYENQSDNSLSLSRIAEKFGFSKEYLSKKFKDTFKCGYSEFLTNTRLATSIKLLTMTSLSVKEIAVKCGFKDSNYYNAVFKKKLGITPIEYRTTAEEDLP